MHGPDDAEAERQEYCDLNYKVAYVPTLEYQLPWFNAAETYKQHEKEQNRLGPAANSLQRRPGRVYGGYLSIDEVCPCTGDHAYYKHPVFKEFEKSAFHLAANILLFCDLRFILAHQNIAKRIMKRLGLINLLSVMLIIWSCSDDWTFSTDSRYVLGFSADTLKMDTVFTGVTSASDGFMVYNPIDVGLRFDALMGGGSGSPFRMNLDGEGGAVITGLEIPAHDSLFCFISVNIPATDQAELFEAFDSIRFVLESGVVQNVKLSARGQNAVRLNGVRIDSDTKFTAKLPYIIYDSLFVAEGATLTLAPGTRLYFHKDAVLDVAGKLLAQGTQDSVILMRGDRIDRMFADLPYDLLAGQWGGIRVRGPSYGNRLEWCDIHGGNWGIAADGADADQVKLSVISSVIHNVSINGIEAVGCRIEVANTQITNAGVSCVDITGGWSEFTFCTIAGFSLWSYGSQAVILADRAGESVVPFRGAWFRNCIITGRHESEFITLFEDSISLSAPYSVSNSLLMVKDTTDARFHNVVFEDKRSKVYGSLNFVDQTMRGYSSVFALDSLSPARGIADTLSTVWPVDLAGLSRPPYGADAGCYQYHSLK